VDSSSCAGSMREWLLNCGERRVDKAGQILLFRVRGWMYISQLGCMTGVDGCIGLCGWLVECHCLVEFGISKKDGPTTSHSVRRLFCSGFSCLHFLCV
jgi:hypothetical protein